MDYVGKSFRLECAWKIIKNTSSQSQLRKYPYRVEN